MVGWVRVVSASGCLSNTTTGSSRQPKIQFSRLLADIHPIAPTLLPHLTGCFRMSAYPPSNAAQPYPYGPAPPAQQQHQQHQSPYVEVNTNERDADPRDATTTPIAGDGQKANRLRKACDSCSIRKVKVRELHMRSNELHVASLMLA